MKDEMQIKEDIRTIKDDIRNKKEDIRFKKEEIQLKKEEIQEDIKSAKSDIESAKSDIEAERAHLYSELQSGKAFSDMLRENDDRMIDSPQRSLNKLVKICRALECVCRIGFWVMVAVTCGLFVLAVTFLISEHFGEMVYSYFDVGSRAAIVSLVDIMPFSGEIPENCMGAIQCFTASLMSICIAAFLKHASFVLLAIESERQPFTRDIARKLKMLPIFCISFILWNPLMGVATVLLCIGISSIFDYGVYLHEQHEQTSHIQEDVILSFAEITEARSGQTGQHVKRVAEYTYIMAKGLNYSEEEAENLRYAAMMHDVGKISIPLEILEKPGKLTDEEFEIIKSHTTEGERLLHNARGEIMQLATQVAYEHHEKWDGTGYPAGKSAERISRAARIVAVADVFDALTSKRSYKNAWDCNDAYNEIVRCSGTQFDPEVVNCFTSNFDRILEIRAKFAD